MYSDRTNDKCGSYHRVSVQHSIVYAVFCNSVHWSLEIIFWSMPLRPALLRVADAVIIVFFCHVFRVRKGTL